MPLVPTVQVTNPLIPWTARPTAASSESNPSDGRSRCSDLRPCPRCSRLGLAADCEPVNATEGVSAAAVEVYGGDEEWGEALLAGGGFEGGQEEAVFRGGGSDLGFLEGGECGPVLEGEGGGLGGYARSGLVVEGGEAGGGSHDCFGGEEDEVIFWPRTGPPL